MKKIIVIFCLLCFVGCSLYDTPTAKVESYLNKYQSNDQDIVSNLDDYLTSSHYSSEQKEKYREIITQLYSDMKYEIKNESINEDKATVEVLIKTYNLYKVNIDSTSYLMMYPEEFNDDNSSYNESKYIDYLLDNMKTNKETINNTITFHLTKNDNGWSIDQLSDNDIMKLHGTFDYE